jgi:tetratricopeptide (TPR) repeat protein
MALSTEAEKLCSLGNELLSKEDFAGAKGAFSDALGKDPRRLEAHLGLVKSLRLAPDLDEAAHAAQRALFLFPRDLRLLNELGQLHFGQDDFVKALEAFERTLAIDPANPLALEYKIKSLRALHRLDSATQTLADALARHSGSIPILTEAGLLNSESGQFDAAVEAFAQAGRADVLLEEIARLRSDKSPDDALALARAALSRFPDNVAILCQQGLAYVAKSDHDRAIGYFDAALVLQPANREALLLKTRSLRSSLRFAEAEQVSRDALQLHKNDLELTAERAGLFADQQRFGEALDVFSAARLEHAVPGWLFSYLKTHAADGTALLDAAFSRYPNHLEILIACGRMYAFHRLYEKSIAAYDRVLLIQPNSATALLRKARSLRELLRFKDAEEFIRESLKKLPGDRGLYSELAELHYEQKQYDRAVEAFIAGQSVETLVTRINTVRLSRRFEEARKLVDAALARRPDDIDLLRQLGWLYYDQKEYRQAIAVFRKILPIAPADLESIRWLSISLRILQLFDEAQACLDAAPDRLRLDVNLLNERGWIEYGRGSLDKSVAAFDQCLQTHPGNTAAIQGKILALRAQAKWDEADKTADEALAHAPEIVELLHDRGELYYRRAELEKADECFAKAERLQSYLPSRIRRVTVLSRLNRGEEARAIIEALHREDPNNLEVVMHLGWFCLGRSDFARAREQFEFIHAKDPNSTLGINSMGALYFNQGRIAEAESEFRKALEADPYDSALLTNLASAILRQERETMPPNWLKRGSEAFLELIRELRKTTPPEETLPFLAEAESLCQRALRLNPQDENAYGCLGLIAIKRGRLIEAEDLLRQSIRINAQDGSYVDLGALYVQMGRYQESEEILEKACKLNRTDAQARIEFGNLYLQTDRLPEATRLFREAAKIDPANADAARALAIALMRKGDYSEAAQIIRKALRTLDESRRWRLHLTLCQLLAELADKSDDVDLYREAQAQVALAIQLKPSQPEPYFHAGVVWFRRQEFDRALKCFHECLGKDPDHLDARQNIRRIKALLRTERLRVHVSLWVGALLSITCLAGLVVLWWLYFHAEKDKITSTMLTTMSPILLALAFVGFLMPHLASLKLFGVEAELSQPKEKISSGPAGSVGFGSSSLGSAAR